MDQAAKLAAELETTCLLLADIFLAKKSKFDGRRRSLRSDAASLQTGEVRERLLAPIASS
jgi:hypothetical protein